MFQRPALVFLALLAGLSTTIARAASIQTISPSQCIWHAGDNPAWSAASLDETSWKPLSSWKVTADQPWAWVRCHANLSELQQADHPALEVKAGRAYQLFLNGKPVGQTGNLSDGQHSVNPDQTFPVTPSDISDSVDTVALRIKLRTLGGAPAIAAGEEDSLHDRHNSEVLAAALTDLPVALGFGVIGVLGFVLLGMYLNDRSHLELLLLAIDCWCLATIRLCEFCLGAMVPVPDWAWEAVYGLAQASIVVEIWFFFRLAGRKVPLVYKLLAAVTLWWVIDSWIRGLAPAGISLETAVFQLKAAWVFFAVATVVATAPFAAFWPWRKIPRAMRAMAACTMLWALMDISWFSVRGMFWFAAGHDVPSKWRNIMLELRGFGTIAAIIALVALLFREHRRTAQERAILAGEMQAAQQIQRILASATIDTAQGAQIEVAFRPMRDVGGDFYLCRALPDGRQRVLVGDVSGKGAAAAMTATLLIGAAENRDADSPAELLSHLNRVLYSSQVGGFATCLCADLEPEGELTLANAGHLSPYLHGEEIVLAPGLPLGLSASHGSYDELRLHLTVGDRLTFLSDGVVEARSDTGELFTAQVG